MNESFTLKTEFSFREKLSYITHAEEYKGIAYKLWTICKLITSCGKCDLLITPSKAKAVKDNNGQCIFSRKVTTIFNHDGETKSNFLCAALENTTKEKDSSAPSRNESAEHTENVINHVSILDQYNKLLNRALVYSESAQGRAEIQTENFMFNILFSTFAHLTLMARIGKENPGNVTENETNPSKILPDESKEIVFRLLSSWISKKLKDFSPYRNDTETLATYARECAMLACDMLENENPAYITLIPEDQNLKSVNMALYDVANKANNKYETIATIENVIWPPLHYNKSSGESVLLSKGLVRVSYK